MIEGKTFSEIGEEIGINRKTIGIWARKFGIDPSDPNLILGKKYGEVEIVEYLRKGPNNERVYLGRCSCGKTKEFFISNLRTGKTKSCGCLAARALSERSRTHGDRQTRLYSIWTNMKTRCENENCDSYKHYGAKGIKVCEEWSSSYESFKEWAIKNGYTDDLTIDRIDNNRGYYPDNCRWADSRTQSRNRDYAWNITIDGITKHAKDWCEDYGVNYKTAYTRLSRGWDEKYAVTVPAGGFKGCL